MDTRFSPAPPGFPRPFGGYLLLSPIAQGGMGDVFLASTMGTAGAVRLVVMKTLREDLASEPGYVNRFLDEARVVIQLQHTNICQVFDVGCHEGTHYFVMEHIAGSNLRRLTAMLARRGLKIPGPLALFIVCELLEGLHCAHHHRHALTGEPLQVVHRDISPQNIMISTQGEVKIIDFGLAESTLKVEQTESKVVLGKIAYMPPEQARGEEVDARSDQFAAAVMLYELLTGARYYGERSQGEIWAIAGIGIVPDQLRELDPELQAILKKALAPKAGDRFATCGELAAALRALLAERNPEVDRAALRDFMAQFAGADLETSEKTVRALSQLALRTLPEIAAARAQAADTAETGTSATQTSLLPSPSRGPRKPWLLAAVGAGVLAALTLLFAWVRDVDEGVTTPPTTAMATPAAGDSTSKAPREPATASAPELPAAVAPAPAAEQVREGVGSMAGAPEPPGPALASTQSPTDATPASGPPKKKPQPKKKAPALEDRTAWPLEKKLAALRDCDHPCTRTIKSVQARGAALFPATVDACVEYCLPR